MILLFWIWIIFHPLWVFYIPRAMVMDWLSMNGRFRSRSLLLAWFFKSNLCSLGLEIRLTGHSWYRSTTMMKNGGLSIFLGLLETNSVDSIYRSITLFENLRTFVLLRLFETHFCFSINRGAAILENCWSFTLLWLVKCKIISSMLLNWLDWTMGWRTATSLDSLDFSHCFIENWKWTWIAMVNF